MVSLDYLDHVVWVTKQRDIINTLLCLKAVAHKFHNCRRVDNAGTSETGIPWIMHYTKGSDTLERLLRRHGGRRLPFKLFQGEPLCATWKIISLNILYSHSLYFCIIITIYYKAKSLSLCHDKLKNFRAYFYTGFTNVRSDSRGKF